MNSSISNTGPTPDNNGDCAARRDEKHTDFTGYVFQVHPKTGNQGIVKHIGKCQTSFENDLLGLYHHNN